MNASVQQALQGVMALAQQGRFAEATAACAKVLAQFPDDPNACMIGGMLAFQTGDAARGITLLQSSLRRAPNNPQAQYNLGVMLQGAGRLDEAVACYDACVKLAPGHGGAWNNRGNALSTLDRLDDALKSFDRAIAIKADYLEAWINKGAALLRGARVEDALKCFDKALSFNPNVPEAHVGRGDALLTLDRTQEALAAYDRALKLRPFYPEAQKGKALALKGDNRLDDVLTQLAKEVSAKPASAAARHDYAVALTEARRFSEALEQCEKAISLAPNVAKHRALAANNLVELYRADEAIAAAGEALALDPDNADALFHRASALMLEMRLTEALADLDRVIGLEPTQSRAPFSKALCCLLMGDYENGWAAYESRVDSLQYRKLSVGGRALDGGHLRAPKLGDVAGKRVLVLDEQGVGDTIMFASILPDLVNVAQSVDVVVDPRLKTLLARSLPGARFHGWPEHAALVAANAFDATVLTGSLGHIFRMSESQFPGAAYLKPDAQKVAAWKARIDGAGKRLVGLSWRGGVPTTRQQIRSIGLADFASIVARPDFVCVSLQHGDVEAEIAAFEREHGLKVWRFPPADTNDLDDLAALVAALDLVVTVQNTNVHLSGALGVPCHAIIPAIPEWRYRASGERMPWYESVRMVRRSADASLENVIAAINARI